MEILLNASKNKEFAEKHPEMMKTLSEEEEGSASGRKKGEVRLTYMPPEEEEKLLAMFQTVVVQDFEDEFHMSKAERASMQERYEKFFRLKKNYTRKVRSLQKYVEAFRLCMEIVDELAETNGVYDPDTFRKKVMNGQITVNGLNFPKFQGKKKKSINWEYVAEFIDDPTLDVRRLTDVKDVADEEVIVDEKTLFSEEELRKMTSVPDEDVVNAGDYAALVGSREAASVGSDMTKKNTKWVMKHCPGYGNTLKTLKKLSGKEVRARSHVWDLEDNEIEALREYDAKIRGENTINPPVFKGDITNRDQVESYLYQMDEYLEDTTFVEYNGRLITVAEKNEMDYRRMLEENGWDLKAIYGNREREKRIKRAAKEDDKRLQALRKMLALTQERSDLRDKGYTEKEIDQIIKEKEKKEAKKKGKGKKKGRKKIGKEAGEITLDVLNREEENFKAYQRKMERM